MIKGITLVRAVAATAELEKLTGFFSALGFEPGKGWKDNKGSGAPFLAPLANLEFVTGAWPAGGENMPEILIEATGLDSVREVAVRWAANAGVAETTIAPIVTTHWNSRMFVAEPVRGMFFGFWESDNPLRGRPVALEGDLNARDMRFGIVVARWNAVITERLLQGALDALLRSGAKQESIQIVRVPGAWEIPAAARMLADAKHVDAVITLAVLLRGETAHYEAIYNEVSRGIGQSQQETSIPHSFGVLTCETLEQALERAGLKMGNKGFEAAVAAIEMVDVRRKIATAAATQKTADR